jgi:hypothetical protein
MAPSLENALLKAPHLPAPALLGRHALASDGATRLTRHDKHSLVLICASTPSDCLGQASAHGERGLGGVEHDLHPTSAVTCLILGIVVELAAQVLQ